MAAWGVWADCVRCTEREEETVVLIMPDREYPTGAERIVARCIEAICAPCASPPDDYAPEKFGAIDRLEKRTRAVMAEVMAEKDMGLLDAGMDVAIKENMPPLAQALCTAIMNAMQLYDGSGCWLVLPILQNDRWDHVQIARLIIGDDVEVIDQAVLGFQPEGSLRRQLARTAVAELLQVCADSRFGFDYAVEQAISVHSLKLDPAWAGDAMADLLRDKDRIIKTMGSAVLDLVAKRNAGLNLDLDELVKYVCKTLVDHNIR